jgi:hypothetical protein
MAARIGANRIVDYYCRGQAECLRCARAKKAIKRQKVYSATRSLLRVS